MPKRHFLRGLRDGFPIGLGYFAVSFGLGISCRAANLTAFQGFLLSFLNNASAGEYGGITIIASDSGFLIMAAMMLVVNARYMLMSCALSQHLSPDTPLIFRLIIGYDLTDERFGIAISQPGYLNVWYYIGAMCAAMPCWSAGTVIGVLLGNLMPVWAVVGGCAQGASLVGALALSALRGRDSAETVVLSGVAQSFGYLIAARGPLMFGVLVQATGGHHVPLMVFTFVAFLQGVVAGIVGRPSKM